MKEILKKYLKKKGLKMSKKISSGGLFSDSTYDNRIVYSLKDLYKLTNEGFLITIDTGAFIFNAIFDE